MSSPYGSIPDPTKSPESLRDAVASMKEIVEILLRQRGNKIDGAVTFQDLVNLGIITKQQVPRT